MKRLYKEPLHFIELMLRWTFAILFILVAVKKFRMGLGGYAASLTGGDTLIAQEFPTVVLTVYGLILPWAELLAGLMLLFNKKVLTGYQIIAVIYLSFVFGQMYNLNTSKIGTEYIPSFLALSLAYYARIETVTS